MNTEHDAIEKACATQISQLYAVLIANLTHNTTRSEKLTREGETDAVEKFRRGLMLARKARDLAAAVIDEPITPLSGA